MAFQKKGNMKKNSPNKCLILEWLLNALDKQLYRGLRWLNKEEKIFYVVWTHKSSEQWSTHDAAPFEAWAEHKGKRAGKNEKQLKATFRCALNSKKKELVELQGKRGRKYWQFIDPTSPEKENIIRKRRKINRRGTDTPDASSDDSVSKICTDVLPRKISSSSEEILTSPRLPNFESFCSFASLTPPRQANESSFSFSESEFSQEKSDLKKNHVINFDRFERLTPNADTSVFAKSSSVGSSREAENSRTGILPAFETFCSFLSVTPPPQNNESYLCLADCRTSCTPSPVPTNPTPPLKNVHSTCQVNSFQKFSTDVWQPNGLTTSLVHQGFNNFSQLLYNDFDELYKSPTHETNHNRMDFAEMDQFVPVMGNNQPVVKSGQYSYSPKTVFENNLQDHMRLDDDLLTGDVDPEAYERLIQELDRSTCTAAKYVFKFS